MALVVTIAGIDRTTVVSEDSIRITQLADSFTFTAELDIYDVDSDIAITTGSHKVADEITFVDGATTYFGGYIANQDVETKESGSRMLHLQCQGYGILLTETLVEYEEYTATADDAIIDDLFDTYLAAIDSVADVAQLDGAMDILFSEMTLAEIMEAICKRTGGRFYIDNVKNLHYFADENDDCGFDLSDTPNQVTSFSYYDATEKRTDASQIVNRVRVIGADEFTVTRSDIVSQGAYGPRAIIITDTNLTTTAEMEERGDAILDKNKAPRVTYTLRTTKAGAVAGQEVDYKNVSLGLAALTTQTIRELYITWEQSEPVYEMTLGEVETSALDRAGYTGVQIRQNVINPPIPLASRGWSHDIEFVATDFNTVAWVDGGTIYTAGGVGKFTIAAHADNHTGNMAAITYVYLDVGVSSTALQTDVDHENTVGGGKILIAVCKNVADEDTNKAIFQVFGGEGAGVLITADNVAADTITANEIAANSIQTAHLDALVVTAAKIAANTITANKLSMGIGDAIFNNADGLLLFGPFCEISPTEWWSLRKQKATLSGAFHQEAGRWQGTRGLVTEEATTNAILNPSIEVDTTGWTAQGTTLSSDSTYSVFGEDALKVITDNAAAGEGTYDTVTAQTTADTEYTFSVYLRGSGTVRLFVWDINGGNQYGDIITLTDVWTRHQITKTYSDGATRRAGMRTNVQQNTTWYCDGFQLEEQDYATTYCDGTLGTGYAWLGAAHDSKSTRAATEVDLDAHAGLISGNNDFSFRIMAQMPYDSDAPWPQANNYLIDAWGAGGRIIVRYNSTDDKFTVYIAGADRLFSDVQTFKAGDWIDIVAKFNFTSDVYKLYLNGEQADSDTVVLAAQVVTKLNLGSSRVPANYGGFNIAEFAIFDRELTLIEGAAMYALQRPLVDTGGLTGPGIFILDGQFKMASSTTGNRVEITSDGMVVYNSAGNAATTLDKAGLLMAPADADISRVKWGPDFASISAYEAGGGAFHYMLIRCDPTGESDEYAMVHLEAIGQGAHDDAMVTLVSEDDSHAAEVAIRVGADYPLRAFVGHISLDVPIVLKVLGANPAPLKGMIFYRDGVGLRYYDGAAWQTCVAA